MADWEVVKLQIGEVMKLHFLGSYEVVHFLFGVLKWENHGRANRDVSLPTWKIIMEPSQPILADHFRCWDLITSLPSEE